MSAALSLAMEFAGLLPTLIQAGVNITDAVAKIRAVGESETAPGSAERAELEAKIAAAEAEYAAASAPRPPGT